MEHASKISPAMKREALRSCWFFKPMRAEELDEIVAQSQERRVARNTTIFHRGDPGTSLMAVLAGRIVIKLTGVEGNKEIAYRQIGPGDIFGEIALLDGKERTADAVAVEDTTLVVVERRVFMPAMLRHEGQVERMFEVLCARIRSTSIALEEATLYGGEVRLARLLCRLADACGRPGPDGSVLLEQRMTDTEWSTMLGGIARETANRLFTTLQAEGLLLREDRSVSLTDLAALREMARGERRAPSLARAPASRRRPTEDPTRGLDPR